MLAEWMVAGEPQNWSLVELGPGRGTLLKDILRVFAQFPRVLDSLSVHLVEASPTLSHTQEATLTGLLHTTFCTLSLSIVTGWTPPMIAHRRAERGGVWRREGTVSRVSLQDLHIGVRSSSVLVPETGRCTPQYVNHSGTYIHCFSIHTCMQVTLTL